MALSLQQMRDYIRTHLDLEVDDLPDPLVDTWLREGSKRIERAEPRWPFFEVVYSWSLPVDASNLYPKASINSALDQITSISFATLGFPPLTWVGRDAMLEMKAVRPGAIGRPIFFSEYANQLSFHPAVNQTYSMTVSGLRRASDWVAGGAGAVPDLPDELHNTVALWGMSKAYAQQEDPELAALYERQFSDELNEYRRRLTIAPHPQPLVLNGGAANHPTILARPRWSWELD